MSCEDLTILVVTQYEACTEPLRDALASDALSLCAHFAEHDGRGAGVIESILDDAIEACPNGYILRIDDDEAISQEMWSWLADGSYRAHDHWAFPRMNLWPDTDSYIASHGLWPDYQTRLSVKAKSGGRRGVHDGSPFGTGEIAPVALEHHKFLVRSESERREILARYEDLLPGSGRHFRAFSLPEELVEVVINERHGVMA